MTDQHFSDDPVVLAAILATGWDPLALPWLAESYGENTIATTEPAWPFLKLFKQARQALVRWDQAGPKQPFVRYDYGPNLKLVTVWPFELPDSVMNGLPGMKLSTIVTFPGSADLEIIDAVRLQGQNSSPYIKMHVTDPIGKSI